MLFIELSVIGDSCCFWIWLWWVVLFVWFGDGDCVCLMFCGLLCYNILFNLYVMYLLF